MNKLNNGEVNNLNLKNPIQRNRKMSFREQMKNYSKEVQSNDAEDLIIPKKTAIKEKILDKYLDDSHPLLECLEKTVLVVQPFWSITHTQIRDNLYAVISSEWPFEITTHNQMFPELKKEVEMVQSKFDGSATSYNGKNISIFMVIWGPLTTIFFANIFHNEPFSTSKFQIFSCGLIQLLITLIIGFAMYVYCNVLKSQYKLYVQHLCVSSFVNLLTIIYSLICVASPDIVLIPLTVIYGLGCVYFHFCIYNHMIKPTLLELIVLLLTLATLYSAACILYYGNFSSFWKSLDQEQSSPNSTTNTPIASINSHFEFTRHFYQS